MILTLSIVAMLVTIVVDYINRPGKHLVPMWKKILMPFEFEKLELEFLNNLNKCPWLYPGWGWR